MSVFDGRVVTRTLNKLAQVFREDTQGLHPRMLAYEALTRALPPGRFGRLRAAALRQVGFDVGEGSEVLGALRLTGVGDLTRKLTIGRGCTLGIDVAIDLEEHVTLRDGATLGHQVMVLTSTHELGPKEHRAGPVTRSPVVIEAGAWVMPRSIVLPGVVVGEGAIVTAGSVVNKSVAAHTRVGGSPAKPLGNAEGGT